MSKLTLTFKGRELKVVQLSEGSLLIGSDPACTIHIDSLAVDPKHARVETHGDDSIIFDLKSEEGTFVNQESINEHKLRDGDMVRVGKHMLVYKYSTLNTGTHDAIVEIDENASDSTTDEVEDFNHHDARKGWLQILSGQNLGKTLSLHRTMNNIGKPGVATAVIAKRSDGFFISHLEGKKTPSVQDKPIGSQTIRLNDGDVIQIGNIRMQFYLE